MTHAIILKFGGTSVSSAKNIQTIVDIVKTAKHKNPILVVSALSGITDLLLSLKSATPKEAKTVISTICAKHKELIQQLWHDKKSEAIVLSYLEVQLDNIAKLLLQKKRDKAWTDAMISHGEILSSYIISKWLVDCGIASEQVVASRIIVTDTLFGNAEFLVGPTRKKTNAILQPLITKKIVPVVTGFIGATRDGKITTFGRGGSDYSASIIGFAIGASEIQIWTDVNGIYTADPRIVKTVHLISVISYKEASELASFGAKVLHPRTLKPVIFANVPLRVLNTFNPQGKGTLVTKIAEIKNPITAISHKKKVTMVNIYAIEMLHQKGFLARVYDIFAKNNISVDLVSSSEVSESIVLDNDENLSIAVEQISKFAHVTVKKDVGMVSLIGEGIVAKTKTIKEIFEVLDQENILVNMVSLGAIDINVSLVIQSDQVEKAVNALHKNFFTL